MWLRFRSVNFWQKKIIAKTALKMLLKLSQARRNWYRKFSLVDARARSDPRLQSSSNSSSTSTLRADSSHVHLSDFLELGPVTSVSAPAINEVEEYTAGHLGNTNNFGRAYLMLPWKAMNKRRHSWICR